MKSEYENVVEKVAKVARKSAEVDTQKRSLDSRLSPLITLNGARLLSWLSEFCNGNLFLFLFLFLEGSLNSCGDCVKLRPNMVAIYC